MKQVDVSDALERVLTLHPKRIDLSLDRIKRLLRQLGNPESKLPPVVHIAGTNGKGSVIAMMRAALEASEKRVHVYTSPHLVKFEERIRLNGELISGNQLSALLEECEEGNRGEPITFFEITTAAAFLAFSRADADILLLETGLGGRLDATNLVQYPILTIITPVSMDHEQFLGNDLASIAGEKAGILKSGVTCVLASQDVLARKAIFNRAKEVGAPVVEEKVDWSVSNKSGNLCFKNARATMEFPLPALTGIHQICNAGIALAALFNLGKFTPSLDEIAFGLKNVEWPARLQRLTRGPLTKFVPDGWEVWLDGGHNGAAGKCIAGHIDDSWRDSPVHLIFGMMRSKRVNEFLNPLMLRAQSVHTVAIVDEENSYTALELVRLSGGYARPATSVKNAVANIVADNNKPGRILICGSLYLAGKVLAENT
ncbi:MAG: bifunctional folylpolyglutamate synthase/dihydrofolate synthase [Magnetovibrio sp.]|nr:bifunctional folylpolyglutamate synthase/dihydrofolate synthase [Magnetovibrio sp.]